MAWLWLAIFEIYTSRDVIPSCFRETGRLIKQATNVISRVAIAAQKLSRRRRRKKRDASTNQSNNLGVSRKCIKPSTLTVRLQPLRMRGIMCQYEYGVKNNDIFKSQQPVETSKYVVIFDALFILVTQQHFFY